MKPSLLSTAFVLPMLPILYVARFLIQTFRLLGKLLGVTVFCGYMSYFFASRLVKSQNVTELDNEQQDMFKELIRLAPEAEPLSKALSKYLEPYLYLLGLENNDAKPSQPKMVFQEPSGSFPVTFAKGGEDEPYTPTHLEYYPDLKMALSSGNSLGSEISRAVSMEKSEYSPSSTTDDLITLRNGSSINTPEFSSNDEPATPTDEGQTDSNVTSPYSLRRCNTRPFKSGSAPINQRESNGAFIPTIKHNLGKCVSEDKNSTPNNKTTEKVRPRKITTLEKALTNKEAPPLKSGKIYTKAFKAKPPPVPNETEVRHSLPTLKAGAPVLIHQTESQMEAEYSKLESYFRQFETPQRLSLFKPVLKFVTRC